MNSTTNDLHSFGVSVRGPLHRLMNIPNQDAWTRTNTTKYSLIVVCDGLGSRNNSNVGASKACKAVRTAVRLWISEESTDWNFLFRLIKLLWEMNISPHTPEECATTCLFAFVTPTKSVLVAGLGDGLGVIRFPDGQMKHVIHRQSEFSNLTVGLGTPHRIDDWKVTVVDQFPQGSSIILATDGVADDLLEEKIPDFIDWLIREFGNQPPIKRYVALRKAIYNWPTPLHQDDKTLAVLYRTAMSLVELQYAS